MTKRVDKDNREPEPIDPAHLAGVLQGFKEARAGQFATEAEIEAAFRGFDIVRPSTRA
ncbi:MAG TPA: hypothetical protein VJN67_17920 [Stellaceae bacterium]|nr:hypothetical protein [Stellaceae bacterium]